AGARDGRGRPDRDRGGDLGRRGRRALRRRADRRLARRRPGQGRRGRSGAGGHRGPRAPAAHARPASHHGDRPRRARPGPGDRPMTIPEAAGPAGPAGPEAAHAAVPVVTVLAVTGLPEITAGADLAALIAAAVPDLRDGDILV